ncbi:hypothetical protein ACQKLN_25400 [Paenibacillus glucanolyticus]
MIIYFWSQLPMRNAAEDYYSKLLLELLLKNWKLLQKTVTGNYY